MQHDWMIDVLSDLKTFAINHKMDRLAEQLDDTIFIAARDMAVSTDKNKAIGADARQNTRLLRTIGASPNA